MISDSNDFLGSDRTISFHVRKKMLSITRINSISKTRVKFKLGKQKSVEHIYRKHLLSRVFELIRGHWS